MNIDDTKTHQVEVRHLPLGSVFSAVTFNGNEGTRIVGWVVSALVINERTGDGQHQTTFVDVHTGKPLGLRRDQLVTFHPFASLKLGPGDCE